MVAAPVAAMVAAIAAAPVAAMAAAMVAVPSHTLQPGRLQNHPGG